MRNIDRIRPLLADIGDVWEQCFSDMRFMQVIVNFQSWLGSDGFYIKDDEFIEKFCKFAEEIYPPKVIYKTANGDSHM